MDSLNSPFVDGFFSSFKVPTRRTVTQWANEKRILPAKGSAAPGQYRSERTPYLEEPMDALSVLSGVEITVMMFAAQTGKSESGNNWVGYVIDEAPGPMLLVQPTVDNAKRYSKQRISPMILETPSLAEKVSDNKSRDASNTMLEKDFPGGMLIMGGANSAAGLRSMPIRYFFGDEISNWPADVDGEGDPLELALERLNSYGRKGKVLLTSTPGLKGVCRIEQWYLKTDQRRYFVPCPHCGHMHVLDWANFVIPRAEITGKYEPAKAYMTCPDCGGMLEERHKTDMLRRGQWRSTCPENIDATRRGYHLSALYSPVGWKSWAKIARQWLEAQGNPKKLQAFANNVLAVTWKAEGESIEGSDIQGRAEEYDGTKMLPESVMLITMGVDVQPDRLEIEVIGWGAGEESWSIEYRVLMGDPEGPLVWQQLDLLLATEYQHPSGVRLRSARTFVDTGGANTVAVYKYVKPRAEIGVFGIKGRGGDGIPAVGNPTRSNIEKIPLVPLGTFVLKDQHYGRLSMAEPGPGYCHFPKHYNAPFFTGLTAEEVRTKVNKKGFPVREWCKKSEHMRNEPLDCRIYGTAAMMSLNVNWEALTQVFAGTWDAEAGGRKVRGEVEMA